MHQVQRVFEELCVYSFLHKPEQHVGNAYNYCSFHLDAICEDQVLLAQRPYWVDA